MALTLRMVAGLTVPEIARAFLVQETTLGRRIARIPYRVPSEEGLAGNTAEVAYLTRRRDQLG